MKYYSTIISLFSLTLIAIVSLLYFANITRSIEKENFALKDQIKFTKDQININEIEFNLYNSYDYLVRLQNIYFDKKNIVQEYKFQRIGYSDFINKNIENFHTVGIK